MKLSEFGIQKPPRPKTLRDLSLADLLELADPTGDPIQAELVRRIQSLQKRFAGVIQERAAAYAELAECQRRHAAAMRRMEQQLESAQHQTG